MNIPVHIRVAVFPRRLRWFMGVLWVVILAKCLLVWWATAHWNLALNPMWVIGPTLVFAMLVTGVWLTHHAD